MSFNKMICPALALQITAAYFCSLMVFYDLLESIAFIFPYYMVMG